jgi:flagellar basal-body rod protein FlgB
MAILDLPLMSMLKTRMHWHQTRQKLLAENVANADTPGFRPHDLREPLKSVTAAAGGTAGGFGGVMLAATQAGHVGAQSTTNVGGVRDARRFEATPSGNAVVLEDEMMKVAQNQSDYQMAATLYGKSLQLLRTAIGRR